MHCISTKKSKGNVDFSIDWIGGYNAFCILIVLQQIYLKSKWFKLMHCELLFDCLLFHVITISEIRIIVLINTMLKCNDLLLWLFRFYIVYFCQIVCRIFLLLFANNLHKTLQIFCLLLQYRSIALWWNVKMTWRETIEIF